MYCQYDALLSKRLIKCFSLLLLVTGVSFSQAVFGSINGTITDPTGAAVPNANVVVTDTDKGTTQTVHSNQDGNYLVEHLIPDHYKIHIESAGFNAVDIPLVQLSADTSPRVDVKLQVGASNQTIEVTAEAPQLQTDRADVSNVLDTRSLEDLPNLTRNTTSFVLLTPGTTASTFFNSVSENPQDSRPIAANGQSPFSSGFILDGADDKESFLGVVVINPPLDALSEMKFTTQNFDAEFEAAVAGIVTAQTKSGSNEFHGSAFEYRHTDAQEARDPLTQYPGH